MTSLVARLSLGAREQLPQDAQLSLELYRDPEFDDAYPTLYVRQRQYARDIMTPTDRIMEPFFPELETCPGWVQLSTDFPPPK